MKRRYWVVIVAVAVLSAGIIAGPALAPRECERQTARRVASFYLGGAPFLVPGGYPDVPSTDAYSVTHAVGVFREVGAPATMPAGPGGASFPIAFVCPARIRWGVVIEVPWGYWKNNLNGLGGVRRYIAVFGLAIPVGEEYQWAS